MWQRGSFYFPDPTSLLERAGRRHVLTLSAREVADLTANTLENVMEAVDRKLPNADEIYFRYDYTTRRYRLPPGLEERQRTLRIGGQAFTTNGKEPYQGDPCCGGPNGSWSDGSGDDIGNGWNDQNHHGE